MSPDWTVRDSTPEDITKIYDLALSTYGHDSNSVPVTFSYEHIAWQLLQCPAGPVRACVAEVGDKLAGFYGVIPTDLYCQGRRVSASLSLLTMTHPDYHRQGIFRTLASRLYSRLADEGVAITYGFPNNNSLPRLVSKLQWAHIATLDVYVRPLNPLAIVSSLVKSRTAARLAGAWLAPFFSHQPVSLPSAFRLSETMRFDDRADGLMEARKDVRPIQQARTAAYLNWRYTACPDWIYRITIAEAGDDLLGYLVLRCMSQFGLKGGMIVDLAALPGRSDVALALVQDAVAYSLRQGTDLSACLVHGDSDLCRALRRCRFLKVPSRLGFKRWYFGARLNDGRLSADVVNNPDNWLLTFGDDDIL